MTHYIIKRLLAAIPTIFIVSVIVFGLLRLIPGDVVEQRLAEGGYVTEELKAQHRKQLGLDRNPVVQYVDWASHAVRGDLGNSLWTGYPVNSLIKERLPLSLEMVFLSLLLAVSIAVPLGVLSAVNRDNPIDYGARLFTIFGLSLPDFAIGTVLILFLTVWLDEVTFGLLNPWLPELGWFPPWQDPSRNIQALIFPALILGYRLSAISARMMRSTMLEVLREDYVRTARAKGLASRQVIMNHALRNAIIPVVTIMAGQIAFVFGGTVIMEQIFRLPGMGRLTLESVLRRDYTVVQGAVMMMAFVFLLVNLLVDVAYGFIDPRIRYS